MMYSLRYGGGDPILTMIINANNRRNNVVRRVAGVAAASSIAALLQNPAFQSRLANLAGAGVRKGAEIIMERKTPKEEIVEIVSNKSRQRTKSSLKTRSRAELHANANGNTNSNIKLVSAPVTFGTSWTQSYAKLQGKPQRLTDQTGDVNFSGVRVSFSDVLQDPYITSIGVPLGQSRPAFLSGTDYGIPITPSFVSQRLELLERMYEFYAFREITFTYVPYDSTATSGNIMFSFMRDPLNFKNSSLNDARDIMQFEGAIASPLWTPASTTMKFRGTKVWTTNSADSTYVSTLPRPIEEYIQSFFLGGLVYTPNAATTHGLIRVTGVIDFYRDSAIDAIADPTLAVQRELNRHLQTNWFKSFAQHKIRDYTEWYKKHGKTLAVEWSHKTFDALHELPFSSEEEKKE